MELILVVVISAGMAGNSQNGVSRSLTFGTVPRVLLYIIVHSSFCLIWLPLQGYIEKQCIAFY